ncbi:MAG: hypothetical protein AAFX94_06570 [Myxococcota bacterium]
MDTTNWLPVFLPVDAPVPVKVGTHISAKFELSLSGQWQLEYSVA